MILLFSSLVFCLVFCQVLLDTSISASLALSLSFILIYVGFMSHCNWPRWHLLKSSVCLIYSKQDCACNQFIWNVLKVLVYLMMYFVVESIWSRLLISWMFLVHLPTKVCYDVEIWFASQTRNWWGLKIIMNCPRKQFMLYIWNIKSTTQPIFCWTNLSNGSNFATV